MDKSVFFSIIIPVFNKADYIARALDSVFAQTFNDYELIIVDDESVDQSVSVIEQYFNARGGIPQNVKIIMQQHAGVGAARNNGVSNSTGHHFVFLDADDWWCNAYLENMKGLIDRWPKAKIFGTGYYAMKDGIETIAPIGLRESFCEGIIVYHEAYARSRSLCMPLTANSYCIARDAFEEVGGYRTDLTLGEDLYLWLKVTLRHPLVFLNKPMSVYSHDVDPKHRAMGRMHKPEGHVIFHLEAFIEDETKEPPLKYLLDRMRVSTLDDYFFIKDYQGATAKIIREVDWRNQSWYDRMIYCNNVFPLPLKGLLRMMKRIKTQNEDNEVFITAECSAFTSSVLSCVCFAFASVSWKTYFLIPLLWVVFFCISYLWEDSRRLIKKDRAERIERKTKDFLERFDKEGPIHYREKTLEEEIAEFYRAYY